MSEFEEGGRPADQAPIVDGFTDLSEIGRGGFSVVYSATQVDFDRRVALKVLDFSGAEARQIEREARAIGRIADLPHVVQAHQVTSTTDGRPVLVMALMPYSLNHIIRTTGPATAEDVARWAAQLTRALDAAHQLDVFHRDIKPENVLISTYHDAYLADFGISTVSSLQSGTTTMQSLSPVHAPPERLAGDTDLDRAGDIYSLASTLYTALTGRAPFGTTSDGGVYGLMDRVMNLPLPESDLVTPEVHRVLVRAMAKDAELRYPSVEQFGTDLATAFGTPIHRNDLGTGRRPAIIPPPYRGDNNPEAAGVLEDDGRTRLKAAGAAPAASPAPVAPADDGAGAVAQDGPSVGVGEPAPPGGPRHRGRLVAAAVLTAVAIVAGVGAVAVARGGDDAPAAVAPPLDAVAVVGGRSHSCALGADGTVSCWGANWFGQLGSGDPPRPAASKAAILAATGSLDNNVSDEWTTTPRRVTGLEHQKQISAGRNHTCAVGEDKRVRCWGSNSYGQLGTPDVGTDAQAEGAWRVEPAVVEGLGDVEKVSAGADFTCALLENRTVSCWGANWDNELGDPSIPPGPPVDGAPAPDKANAWTATPVAVVGLEPAIAISAGGFHVCALLSDARVKCWGDNGRGQIGSSQLQFSGGGRQARTPTPTLAEVGGPVVQLSAGLWHTCVVLEDGTAQCWGDNEFGQLGNRLKSGADNPHYVPTPVRVVGVTDATRIAAGGESTCVLQRDGSAVCFGNDEHGQLGSGADDQRPERWTDKPEQVDTDALMSEISVAYNHACAVADEHVQCWGANGAGQVGSPDDAGDVVGGVDSPVTVRTEPSD